MSSSASDSPLFDAWAETAARRAGDLVGWPRLYVQHYRDSIIFEIGRGVPAKSLPWRMHYCAQLGTAWVPVMEAGKAPGHFIGRVARPVNPEITGRVTRGLLAEPAAAVAA